MRSHYKPEVQAVARFLNSLPDETRAYVIEMVYRVAGDDEPPPPKKQRLSRAGNVIPVTFARAV